MARPERFELPTPWFEALNLNGPRLAINELRQVPVAHLHSNAQQSRTESGKTPALTKVGHGSATARLAPALRLDRRCIQCRRHEFTNEMADQLRYFAADPH